MNVFIACPIYKQEHPAHVVAARETVRHFAGKAQYHVLRGDSCLARARAALFAAYLRFERPWTHFLQVDDDQSWDPSALEHLVELSKKYPLLGIPCAYKFDPPHAYAGYSTIRGKAGEAVAADGTVECRYLGGGFILWRRDLLERMCAAYPERAFDTNSPGIKREPTWNFWSEGVVERELLSEDYMACHLAAQLGVAPRAWLGAASPHWQNPPAGSDPSLWKAWVPTGYGSPTLKEAA